MRCIIIDDEPFAREGIALMVKEVPFLELLASFSNAIDADAYLLQNAVDLLFLDIKMPKISGLDYLRNRPHLPKTILTTAYAQYALEGFDLDVVDYLVKPVRFERFYKAVLKAKQATAAKPVEIDDDHIFVRADKKFFRVSFSKVSYIEGMKDYCIMHIPPDKIIVALNLKTIQDQLPVSYFMRINKSHIVNLTQIKYADADNVSVGNELLPVGESYKEALQEYIQKVGVIRRQ